MSRNEKNSNKKSRKNRRIIKVVLLVLGFVILATAATLFYFTRGLQEGVALEIGEIYPLEQEDGRYSGSFDFRRWSNQLEIVVEDGTITEIGVLDDIMVVDGELAGKIFTQVLEKQSLKVDIVAGATVSSKAYLKALENAFNVY